MLVIITAAPGDTAPFPLRGRKWGFHEGGEALRGLARGYYLVPSATRTWTTAARTGTSKEWLVEESAAAALSWKKAVAMLA
jgi:hypothetical protein